MQFKTIATIAFVALLAGCQGVNFGGNRSSLTPKPAAVKPAADPNSLNGQWIPTDEAAKGVYVATFRDNVFVSKSPSDGKVLAKGNYTVQSESQVKLQFEGAATKTVVNADCQRPTPTTLYCVPSIGSPFNLQRQS